MLMNVSSLTSFRKPTGPYASWLLPPLAGLVLAATAYLLLPMMGVHGLKTGLGIKGVAVLCGLLIGGVAYVAYLFFITARPQWLVGFILLAWPLVDAVNFLLLGYGINIHLRPLLLVTLALPMLCLGLPSLPALLWRVPYLKYYAVFFLWVLLYFLFNNTHAIDPTLAGESVWSEGSSSAFAIC